MEGGQQGKRLLSARWCAAVLSLALSFPLFANDLDDAHKAYAAGEFELAARLLQPLAVGGQANAQYLLGRMYEQGDGVTLDVKEAQRLYALASAQGHDLAGQRLAQIENSEAGEDTVVVDWYLPAAQDGDTEAQYNLGFMFETGWGVAVDEKQAARWYREAADMQHDMAQLRLGMMFVTGSGVEEDLVKGVELLRESAENGNRLADVLVQELFDASDVDRLAPSKIVSGIRRVMDDGEQKAIHALHMSLEKARKDLARGRAPETQTQPTSTSVRFENDNTPVAPKPAPSRVADASPQTVTNKSQPETSLTSTLSENSSGSARFKLGQVFDFGLGVAKDEAEMLRFYREAALDGDKEAQFSLGMLYVQGRGVTRDLPEGRRWLRLAAEQGQGLAKSYLELWTNELDNLAAGGTVALSWLKDNARQGDAGAIYELGYLFEHGRGVNINHKQALKWYRLAAALGQEDARKAASLLQKGGVAVDQALGKTRAVVAKSPERFAEDTNWLVVSVGSGVAVLLLLGLSMLFKRKSSGQNELTEVKVPDRARQAAADQEKAAVAPPQKLADEFQFLDDLWSDSEPAKAPSVEETAAPKPVPPPPVKQAVETAPVRVEEKVAEKPSVTAPVANETQQADSAILESGFVNDDLKVDSSFSLTDDFSVGGISRDELPSRIDASELSLESTSEISEESLIDVEIPKRTRYTPSPPTTQFEIKDELEPESEIPSSDVHGPLTDEEERSLAEVHFNIGLMFANGDGVPKNDQLAAKWYLKAAEEGLPEAQLCLCDFYLQGRGVEKDPEMATVWLQKSADAGYEPAKARLNKRNQAS